MKLSTVHWKNFGKTFFVIFLIFYMGTIVAHSIKIEHDILPFTFLLAGVFLSIFAHAKRNYITVILLALHMSIEWFEWSQKSMSIETGLLNFLHVIMDFIFLWHELSAHVKKHRMRVISSILVFLIIIFIFGYKVVSISEDVFRYMEPFVIGGVFGCISSHLYYHLKIFGRKSEEGGGCCD